MNVKIETMKENRLQNVFRPVNKIKGSGNECNQRDDGITCIHNSFVAECNRIKYTLIKNFFMQWSQNFMHRLFENSLRKYLEEDSV